MPPEPQAPLSARADMNIPFSFLQPPLREPESVKYYQVDGVFMSQQAKRAIEKIVVEPPKVRRKRRWSKKPENWDATQEETLQLQKKMAEIREERKGTTEDGASATVAPALQRLLSSSSDKDEQGQ